MKLREFVKCYNLHDSLLENIEFDEQARVVKLTVDFCYWQQPDYKEGDLETGLISLLFTDVARFDREEHPLNSDEIIACICLDDNTLNLQVESDIIGNCHTIVISAGAVSVAPVET